MQVDLAQTPPNETSAGLLALTLFDGEELPEALRSARGAGDARATFKAAAVIHPDSPERAVVVGLGKREDFDAERARTAGAIAARRAGSLRVDSLALAAPDGTEACPAADAAAAMIEGAILAAYRFDRFKSGPGPDEEPKPPELERIEVLAPADASEAVERARVSAEAANRAREHQDLPSNVATPTYLADRAREIASQHERVSCEVLGRDEIAERKMGGLVAVSQGTAEEPQFIVLRYEGGGDVKTAFVGKAVTFDTGGISIKPSGAMHEMKMDMSGGAAALEATAAIAELGLPLDLLTVIPATENMPSGTAIKPGDIITQLNGKTVEVNNTDAEGRLILADALAYAVEQGADRIVDLATLTGAVLVALGSTYAALISNDDEWAERVRAASERTGEIAWRLPLHEEYKDLTRGVAADLTNAAAKRKAGTIYAGSFLEEFVDGRPWAHLDIAGTAWDTGRAYAPKGPTGFGVRLLIDLAHTAA